VTGGRGGLLQCSAAAAAGSDCVLAAVLTADNNLRVSDQCTDQCTAAWAQVASCNVLKFAPKQQSRFLRELAIIIPGNSGMK